jgi:50S ribosomal protein L16 3-hydroxylase
MNIEFLKNDQEKTNFLKNNWNKTHHVFKSAISNIFCLDEETICELISDEDIESRIVVNKTKRELYHGPFNENEITTFLEKDHNIIIHNLNDLFIELNTLEEFFKFLPQWEFDDIICTYSNKGMSLGAHYDPYNVFIIQAQGKRKWELQYNPDNTWKDDEEIKVLQNFKADVTVELSPGDILYIPPKVAHHGISIDKSLSYSVGFKSLRFKEMFESYLIQMIDKIDEDNIYLTKPLKNKDNFPAQLIDFFQENIEKTLLNNAKIDHFLKSYITQPKENSIESEFDLRSKFQKDANTKWINIENENILFVNGEKYILENRTEKSNLINYLSKSSFEEFVFTENDFKIKSLQVLINKGVFFNP